MEARHCFVLFLMLMPVVLGAWKTSKEERIAARDLRRGVHYHTKRHMLPIKQEAKKRLSSAKPRDVKKKTAGNLAPLEDDDMDNDEVMSVAIGPPPIRAKYEKVNWKHNTRKQINATKVNNINNNNDNYNNNAVSFVKDVLTQLGREFLLNQVNENFVFGQYVGNSMKNLTSEVRLKMQHDILDLIVKYQKMNVSETNTTSESNDVRRKEEEKFTPTYPKEIKLEKKLSNITSNITITNNETDDGWPDFSNLAKIVG